METKEELMKKVGSFGFFQKRTLCVAYLMSLLAGPTIMLCNVFSVYTPTHRCYIPDIDDNPNRTEQHEALPEVPQDGSNLNSTNEAYDTLSQYIPIETGPDGLLRWSQCYRYKYNNTQKDSELSKANRSIIDCDHGWKYFVKPGLSSATTEFDLVCSKAWLAPLASSVQVFGFLLGTVGGGFLSDRFGRRFAILLSWSGLILCEVAISLLPVWEAFYPFWFFMGAGFIARSTNGVIIINELTPVKYRYRALFLNMVAAAFSYMLIPFLNYLVQSWRCFLALYAGLQAVTLVLVFFFIKESLNWLLQNKEYDKALDLIKEIGRTNNRPLDTENLLLSEYSEKLKAKDNVNSKEKQKRLTYIDLAKISFLRQRMLLLALAWIAVSLCYYGLSINTNDLGGDRYIASFLSGAMEVPGYLLCYIGLEKLGGRKSYMIMTGLSGVSLLILPWLLTVNETAVMACNMIGKLFISGSFAIMYVFVGDFFPTLLRTQSYGATSFPARLSTMVVPFLLYAGEQYFKPLPYLVMGSIAICAAFGMCFLPETKNLPLPETMEDAKNLNKNMRVCCKRKPNNSENDCNVSDQEING